MTISLHDLKGQVQELTGEYNMDAPNNDSTPDISQPVSNWMTPCTMYMSGIVLCICVIFMYQKPCFVCKQDEKDKKKKRKIDMQWFFISTIVLSAVCIWIAYPYIK